MLVTYVNDFGLQSIAEVSSIYEKIKDYNGGESIAGQLEVFVTGADCNSLELMASTQWANECTDNNMLGVACCSDEIFNDTCHVVVFDGIGGVNEYLKMLNMQPIFDYYPVKNLRGAIEYYNYKTKAKKAISARN